MRQTLRFEVNVPVEVALAFDRGKLVEGRYGDQLLYTLSDDRVMYVPPIVGDRIQQLGIGRAEPFVICKREIKQGQHRSIEWKVERSPNGNGSARNKPSRVPEDPGVFPAPQPTPRTVLVDDPQTANSTTPPAPPAPSAQTSCASPDPLGVAAAFMLTALCAALDVVNMAEKYATGKGIAVKFAGEDVRAIGNTLFIRAAGGGR